MNDASQPDRCELPALREMVLDALYTALPFVEDALLDGCYKRKAVEKAVQQLRRAIDVMERAANAPDGPQQVCAT